MSRYGAHVLPRLTRLWLGGGLLAAHRSALLAQVGGRVLEVGIGSGTSLPHYPAGVRHLVGLDVSAAALGMASRRNRASFPVALVRGPLRRAGMGSGGRCTGVPATGARPDRCRVQDLGHA